MREFGVYQAAEIERNVVKDQKVANVFVVPAEQLGVQYFTQFHGQLRDGHGQSPPAAWIVNSLTPTLYTEARFDSDTTCATILSMEPNDVLPYLIIGLLALISFGAILVVGYMALRSLRRRRGWRIDDQQPAEASAAPPAVVIGDRSLASMARLPQPAALPELIAEAADTPRDERLINAAASTMKTLSPGMQDAVWVAVVPRQFNIDLLAALRPDWGELADDVYERLQRLWFISAVPDGSCVQAGIRRAMLHHLYRKDDQRETYLRYSLRAAKYFHVRMVSRSDAYNKRNARFVSDTFFRFRPPNCQSPQDEIEWLYHLAVADSVNAPPALQQIGDDWLKAGRLLDLQNLLDALREHIDDGRLTTSLCALVYYYAGRVALRGNRARNGLSALEQARRLSRGDQAITNRIQQAIGEALDVLTAPDRSLVPDSSVWSSLSQPVADRTHWGLWADLQLPQPGDDGLRRTHEMLRVYQSSSNYSGAALAMRLIGDAHRGRGDYRAALEWYENSRTTLQQAARSEGERQSALLDEAITLKALGDTQYLLGWVDDALNSYAESLRLHELMPDDELHEADAHKARGDVLHFLTRYMEALPEYETALAAYRKGGAVISEGETLLAQGRLFQALQRQAETERCYEEALGIYQRSGSSLGSANALLVIGSSALLRDQPQLAQQRFEEALNVYRKQKNEAGEAAALKALGDASVKLRQFDRAAGHYDEALTQFRTAGLRRNAAETELAVGQLLLRRKDYPNAAQRCEQALAQFGELQDRRGEADAKLVLGEVRQMQRQSTEAGRLWTESLAAYDAARDRVGEAQTLSHLGEECLLLHDHAGALTNFQAALNLWREIGDPIGAVEMLYARVGHCLALLDRRDEAARAFEQAMKMHSPREFGWQGWCDVVHDKFEDALVHFTAMTRRDPATNWQVGLALAQLVGGNRIESERQMDAALRNADPRELGEACRWIEVVARLRPALNLKAEQYGLMC
jgi:tetratricopeptide (TPR) repeat protein